MTTFDLDSFFDRRNLTDEEFDDSMVELTKIIDSKPLTQDLDNFLSLLDIMDEVSSIGVEEIMGKLYDALLKCYNQSPKIQCSCSEDGFDEALCIFETFCENNNIKLVLPKNEQGN